MGFMSAQERAVAAALPRLGYANPFLPERIEAEGAALGPAFVHADRVWSVRTDRTVQNPNVARLAERATTLAALLRERLAAGAEPAESDRVLYEDVVLYLLYTRYEDDLLDLVMKAADAGDTGRRELTADQLLARYCALVYAETRSYQETARRLSLDRRTVKSKVDQYKTEGR